MDPRERLQQAQQAAAEGRHAEALRGYEWFHRNALKHEPSLYGVRLSFALWYWLELGKVYPKARRSLERIRAHKTRVLLARRGNRELFHDVASINEYLGRERDTYRLFKWLDAKSPRLAARCASIAMPAIVRARDFRLARRHIPDPEDRLVRLAKQLADDLAWARSRRGKTRAPSRQAFIRIYSERVRLLVSALEGSGERERAADVGKLALKLVRSPSVRKAVTAGLRA